jgi:hypothetical protein
MPNQTSANGRSPGNAELRARYLLQLRAKLALAVRERGISSAQAAVFDQTMRELLGLHRRDPGVPVDLVRSPALTCEQPDLPLLPEVRRDRRRDDELGQRS